MPNNKSKWYNGVVIKRVFVEGESSTERTFKVFFHDDEEVCDLQFDDDQYITHWNIVSPMASSSSQPIPSPFPSPISEVNGHIQAATDKAIQEIDAQVVLYKKHLHHDPQTSAREHKTILCKMCFNKKDPKERKPVIYIYAHGLLKYILGINVDPKHVYTNKKAKSFITRLKKEYGVCSSCAHGTKFPLIRIDSNRFSNCCICKIRNGNKTFDLPVCNSCQQLSTNNIHESLLQSLLEPMVQLINSSSNTIFNDAVMNINTTLPGLSRRPDGTISFSYMDDNRHKINILFLIEIDKKQHATYADETSRTVEILKSLKNHTTYDKAVLFRLNTDDYLDEKLQPQEAPTIFTRYVILRCWLMFFFINSRKIPPFSCLYLFYSSNSDKLLKSSVPGFIGRCNYAPKNDSDIDNNWIYGIDLTEGQLYLPMMNAYNTWGKNVASKRVSVNKAFDVPNVMENLWTRWMHKDTLVSKLIADNES